jgi:hypothetical protein
MSSAKIKDTYDSLLKNGDLLDMFPMLEGKWPKDKDTFTEMFLLNSEILNED